MFNRSAVYLRGAGGFSQSPQPYSYTKHPSGQISTYKIPESQPFVVFEECTHPSQVCVILFLGPDMVVSSEAHGCIGIEKW